MQSQSRGLESRNHELEDEIQIQRSTYQSKIEKLNTEIMYLTSKTKTINNFSNVPTRTDLYRELISELASLYRGSDPLAKLVYVYRCQVFVYGLQVLPWTDTPSSLYEQLQSISDKILLSSSVFGGLVVKNLLAREDVYLDNVIGAEYPSVAGMMYCIFGSELPGGVETGKQIWTEIKKSNYGATMSYCGCDENCGLKFCSIALDMNWTIYEILLSFEKGSKHFPAYSDSDRVYLNDHGQLHDKRSALQ